MQVKEKEVLAQFVALMVEFNEVDPLMYTYAQRRIVADGADYWDGKKFTMLEDARYYVEQQANELKIMIERLGVTHTCLPTRSEYESYDRTNNALMRDYAVSQNNNWSTD